MVILLSEVIWMVGELVCLGLEVGWFSLSVVFLPSDVSRVSIQVHDM